MNTPCATTKKILFVCTGNTCRSVMAAALARKAMEQLRPAGVQVEITSAGLAAIPGDGASRGAVIALREKGIDISNHLSATLAPRNVEQADLVLTMTDGHRSMLCRLTPACTGKIHTLAQYAGAGGDIPDPFGQNNAVYRRVAARLDGLVRAALVRFLKENGTTY